MLRIGVISDTHGKVPPEAFTAFGGVNLILHAGDIGGAAVIAELETIARVIGVRGNTDLDLGPPQFPVTRRLALEGVTLFLCHQAELAREQTPVPDVIIFGHTHQALNALRQRTLWFNPGTASAPRFGSRERTVGILTLQQGTVQGEIIPLSGVS